MIMIPSCIGQNFRGLSGVVPKGLDLGLPFPLSSPGNGNHVPVRAGSLHYFFVETHDPLIPDTCYCELIWRELITRHATPCASLLLLPRFHRPIFPYIRAL